MTIPSDLIMHLAEHHIQLWVEADQLRVRAPKGALTPDLQAQLKQHKAGIITWLQTNSNITASLTYAIKPVDRSQPLPLSSAQERIWFLQQLVPENSFYNIPIVLQLTGHLDVDLLEKSLNTVVNRHEALCTKIQVVQDRPVQQIEPLVQVPFLLHDWRGRQRTATSPETQALITTVCQQPFDLTRAPLIQTQLIQLSDQQNILVLVLHHIIADAWSLEIIFDELSTVYSALAHSQENSLPPVSLHYADVVVWQKAQLKATTLKSQLAYWHEQLQGALPLLEFPISRPRPAIQSYRGGTYSFTIPGVTAQEMKIVCRQARTTPFTAYLAALKVLLYRYTQQNDILIGTPVANRQHPDVEQMVGLLTNTVVIRSDISAEQPFFDFLQQVQQTTIEAISHQDVPFEQLVELHQPERNLSHSPLFQVMFIYQDEPLRMLQLPGITWQQLEVDYGSAKFDLTLFIRREDTKMRATFEFNRDLFSTDVISVLAQHFLTLLAGITADATQQICQLPLLSQAERQQILHDWNETVLDYERDCLHQAVAHQAQQTPEAIALITENEQLTYVSLDKRSNQLAHYLQAQAADSKRPVAICLERGVDMVIAILAVLKSGHAYVPLDPTYPQARLDFIVADTQAPIILTQSHLRPLLAATSAPLVCLDEGHERWYDQADTPPPSTATADDLAYIIYTSGSTGQPKGVMLTHGNAAAMLAWARQTYGPEERRGVLATTSICFDLSIFELFLPLTTGGTVILAHDLLALPTHSAAAQITLINTVPSAIQALLRQSDLPPNVSTVNLAGEPLSTALVNQVYAQPQVKRVYDLYGPSEDTTYSTYALRQPDGPAVIGRPIANTQLYILDSYQQPVPVGVVGEIYLAGDGVAQGYLRQPELTSERFLANPFNPGTTLYKTGDLARFQADGQVEFLGRNDYQVKVRGYRIELGEIETSLNSLKVVRQAVVALSQDMETPQLIAYLVLEAATVAVETLRQQLEQILPNYMIPTHFVMLDELPLTPNGKVDRQALPALAAERPLLTRNYSPPSTPSEKLLQTLWQDVLSVSPIGIHDNFFALGGHSLLATQIISRLQNAHAVSLTVQALFTAPTIAQLATQLTASTQQTSLPIAPRKRPLPVSLPQQRLWFLEQLEPNNSAYNLLLSFQLNGILDETALHHSLNQIIARHDSLRTTIMAGEFGPIQHIVPQLHLDPILTDLSGLEFEKQHSCLRQIASAEAHYCFNLQQGPLVRVNILRLSSQEHVLLLNFHHLITDGWSNSRFCYELGHFYTAHVNQELPRLAPLTHQYADFAYWQQQSLQNDAFKQQLAYWQQKLAGDLPRLSLPTDHPRTRATHTGASLWRTISPDLTQTLKQLSQRENSTLFVTLLAAFKLLLHRCTGQEDLIVGLAAAGRNHYEIEPLIGFFVNTLVLRNDISQIKTFRAWLRQVRQSVLEAYENQDVPFEKLVEMLQPHRDLSRNPIFDILFNYDSTPVNSLQLAGLQSEPLTLVEPEAKFDLSLYVTDDHDQLNVHLVYRSDLFEREHMQLFFDQYLCLLQQIAAEPDQLLTDYSLITPTMRLHLPKLEQPLSEPDYPFITDLIVDWSIRAPQRVAISNDYQAWTYADLVSSSHGIARQLLAQGLQHGEVVAVSGRRSFGLIATMLAVFYSGGVLLNIDPSLPQKRQETMLELADAHWLCYVGHPGEKAHSVAIPQVKTIPIDAQRGQACHSMVTADIQLPQLTKADAAYIFFTSGTTGTPKGVLGSHKGMAHFIQWQREKFKIGPEDRCGQLTIISLDMILRDLFTPLSSGARVCIPHGETADARYILPWLDTQQITLLHVIPAVVQTWLSAVPDQVTLCHLRYAFLAGEPLKESLIHRWRRTFPQAGEIINVYGPTETTMAKNYFQVPYPPRPGIQPVGQPLPQTDVFVSDETLQPRALGEVGEIIIRTPFRSFGYINAPNEQALRFVPNPYRDDPTDLLYRTGDLGRRRWDGQLEILGRMDDQVKIRGFRIELGEIEATLNRHPQVQESIVLARLSDTQDKRLVAYVVINQEPGPDEKALRHYLSLHLPEYMVPSVFMRLTRLPLALTGKVDRRALPAPDWNQRWLETPLVEPQTMLEKSLVSIWSELLGVESIGIHDNFFQLGGHSLLATRVMGRIQETLNIMVPLYALFEAPTVAGLAERLETETWHRASYHLPATGNQSPGQREEGSL